MKRLIWKTLLDTLYINMQHVHKSITSSEEVNDLSWTVVL